MEKIDENRRTSFGAVAELYHRARPGYPLELSRDVLVYAQITSASRIVESGAGTGKATVDFAKLGASLTALEPSSEMAEVLRQTTRDFKNVTIRCEKFEETSLPAGLFDLVFAAQSFHWIPKEIKYANAAALLRPGGTLAVFWNSSQFEDWNPAIRKGLDEVYERYFDGTQTAKERESIDSQIEKHLAEIRESKLFEQTEARIYPWQQRYTSAEYTELLDTYSDNRVMEGAARERFFADVRAVLDANGGSLSMPFRTLLFLGKTKAK